MQNFVREKQIYCGKEYKEVDIYGYTSTQKTAAVRPGRSRRHQESSPKQKDLNDKNARRYFTQLANLNFLDDPGALHVTATYKCAPETIQAAEKEAENYLRRLKHRRKKQGLPPLKYLLVTSYTTERRSGQPVRVHHHILINSGLDRDEVERLWSRRGKSIGYCNADRLQADEDGISALCGYLVRQSGGKKRWSSSHNLKRPQSCTNDGRYTRRQLEKWARERPSRAFWERKYPGWTPIGGDYGVKYVYNEVTGWGIYLKLRRKE